VSLLRCTGQQGDLPPLQAPDGPAPVGGGLTMAQPVVHFEIIGKNHEKLQGYVGELFG
jgi:hypothetical protein